MIVKSGYRRAPHRGHSILARTIVAAAALIGYLEKTISSKEHKAKAEALSLDPQIIKGEDYRKFLKDNEQATKKLMGW